MADTKWEFSYREDQARHAELLLLAFDIAFRHDIRPVRGPNAGETTINARQDAACEMLAWATGTAPGRS